jgi:hypothetical protein
MAVLRTCVAPAMCEVVSGSARPTPGTFPREPTRMSGRYGLGWRPGRAPSGVVIATENARSLSRIGPAGLIRGFLFESEFGGD